jgi:hypothetical protein
MIIYVYDYIYNVYMVILELIEYGMSKRSSLK